MSIKTITGAEHFCSIKEGWKATFYRDHIMLVHPDHAPYFIPVSSLKSGDVLPREADTQVSVEDINQTLLGGGL